jgi:hypothetical protein
VGQRFARARTAVLPAPSPGHRVPLGLLLMSRGQLTNSQLRSALAAQSEGGYGRLGYWLEKLELASEQQITAALGMQWACPILPAFAARDAACPRILPFRLLEHFRMLPVHWAGATRVLYVAFSQDVDYTALYAIERMLDCRTEASLLSRSAMELSFERLRHERRSGELLFEDRRDPEEMARTTCGYALKLGARELRIVTCGEYIWARLESSPEVFHLLFRRPVDAEDGELRARPNFLRPSAAG